MGNEPDITENQTLDVKNVLYSKNPALARGIPGFCDKLSEKDCAQDELNEFLNNGDI